MSNNVNDFNFNEVMKLLESIEASIILLQHACFKPQFSCVRVYIRKSLESLLVTHDLILEYYERKFLKNE